MGKEGVHRTAPVPPSERMAALRERRRKAGLKPLEIWAHPDDHQAIRDEAARLVEARDQAANASFRGGPEARPAGNDS